MSRIVWIFQFLRVPHGNGVEYRYAWTRMHHQQIGRSALFSTFSDCWRDAERYGLTPSDEYQTLEIQPTRSAIRSTETRAYSAA